MNEQELNAYNLERGYLSLDDTERLLKVAGLLEQDDINEAYTELQEFLAERGYDENPPVKESNK